MWLWSGHPGPTASHVALHQWTGAFTVGGWKQKEPGEGGALTLLIATWSFCGAVIYSKKYIYLVYNPLQAELLNPLEFPKSLKLFVMLMRLLGSPQDGGWLPREPTRIRGLELQSHLCPLRGAGN